MMTREEALRRFKEAYEERTGMKANYVVTL